jgi:hypothetical protein
VNHNSDDGTAVDRIALAVEHRGTPVLVMIADAPRVKRFDVFVSAYDGSRGEPEEPDEAAAVELRGAGLALERGRAGVHLSHPGSDPRFCEAAAAAWMLDRAVRVAAGSGA